MKAVEITRHGAPDVLQLCERPEPSLRPGEVLVRVHAAGVNRPDVFQRKGHYPAPSGASDLPGLEVAGEIVGGDCSTTSLRMGDAICALVQGGGYAEFCAVPALLCLPIPSGLSFIEAASLPETYFTVWSNVFDNARLALGESLLVQGGSSGIGVAAIQLARALESEVYVTAGTAEKCRACEALGARRAIDYRQEDFVEVVRAATQGRGVDVILDMVAGDYIERELNCLADDGRLVLIAMLGGARANLDLGQIMRRRLHITGSTLRARPVAFKAAIARQLQAKVWPLLESKVVRPVVYETFPLEQAAEAHRLMESGAHIGKLVLSI